MELYDFLVNYQQKPIGLDEMPRFSWKIKSDARDTMQLAYRLIVTMEEEPVWDSGIRKSEDCILIPYEGNVLFPMSQYKAELTVWDNHGNCVQSETGFETGLGDETKWKGIWITHNREDDICPVFTKSFPIKEKEVKRARIYATACGVYEVLVNGKKAGDAFLAPGWTSYHNRIQYQTYDVTGLVRSGENEIRIPVGNGWYKGYLNGEGEHSLYGDRTAVRAMCICEYEDGEVLTFGTDEQWMVTTGEIQSSELYMGEIQDYTKEASHPEKANAFQDIDKIGRIIAQECEPVRVTKRIPAKEKIITPKGEVVIDFGQNMAGLVEIKLPPLKGEELVIRHAESLDKDGNFYTENYRTAISRDVYRYTEREIDKTVMPHFTYHGFRYIAVEGAGADVDISRFCACAMHTDMPQTGTFTVSNPLVSRLQSNIEWGQRSNYFDIPTDCPQRDERLGWTGDAQIFAPTGCFNFQSARFLKKWLRDVAAESDEETGVPQIVPNIVSMSMGTTVWSDCATIIPWVVYQVYGDVQVLEEQYDNMKLWVEFVRKRTGEDVLWLNGFQRGDWLSLDSDESLHLMSGGTDKNLVANVYYAYSVRILRDTAKLLGKAEWEEYEMLYKAIVDELNEEYVTSRGRVVTETQTACALLLHFDLLHEKYRARVMRTLEENLEKHKGKLTTGFVGTPYLCHALSDNGRHDLAEGLLLNEEYPGWLYAVKRGATTIWERWNSIMPDGEFDQSGMNSLNHYSFGSVGDWMYKKIAGIHALEPGYKKIQIKPLLTHTMQEVHAGYESAYGRIAVDLSCKDKMLVLDVLIPANTTAEIVLPESGETVKAGSGRHHFEYAVTTDLSVGKYTMNSTVEEILADKEAWAVFIGIVPGMKDNPVMEFIKTKTLSELAGMTGGTKEYFLQALEQMKEAGV